MSYILDESIGYLILIGVGILLASVVLILVKAETKWLGTKKTFEWFSTAGRTVKTGLIVTSVVSAWTWAATLLQSSTVAYQYGISGPFWYAAGASIQVVLFAILAIELKRKSPMSHTFPEMINSRFGKSSHKVFLSFAFLTNIIVTAMLVLGGAAVVNALTGINVYIAAFLIPVGVIAYTLFGGLKATFLAEYFNTAFIFVVVLIFTSAIYFVNPDIGGISGMFEKLSNAAAMYPVEGNAAGSFLTLASVGALIFGVINIVGNFGTVFVDQSYWQRAIASRPRSVVPGFLVGGLAWFAIPFALATTLGLAAVAVNLELTPLEISSGLVAPLAAAHLLGDIGAILMLTVLFTAVTAAGSAQLISVSSLVTYDVFRTYIKPSSTGRQLMRISRYAILGFGLGMGALASMLFQFGVSLQYVYLAMGVLIGSAVAPISLAILWKDTNRYAATIASIIGLGCGVTVWLGYAYATSGEISLASTSNMFALLAGNLASILTSLVITVIGSLFRPENFNFSKLKHEIFVVDEQIRKRLEKETNEESLKNASKFSMRYGLTLTLILVVVWPIPLFLSNYVFTETVYHVWIWVAILWAATAGSLVWALPIIQSRSGIAHVLKNIVISSKPKKSDKYGHDLSGNEIAQKILVAVDGSVSSMRSLNYVNYVMKESSNIKVYLAHIIEWTDDDESMDEEMTLKMEQDGRKMLLGILLPSKLKNYERIVKLGDPAKKISELATSLNVDTIVMGRKGLSDTDSDLGHVTSKLLTLSSKPIVLV
ncbi:sodium/solute symporter [Candidatus Nitrosopelagicus sp.]|uniref:Urea active transporter n=1 Tax=uncultured marine thaumarchaeote KM3_13_C11 TaxID=1456007 RepID=A0A075GA13_9ARCH|nr:urea active transporter [uncultured marine thaumarchaeote KM3_13_C11]MDC0168445.1 sodium/solute symporter [Candidatus Nitrosopelagicus sp.]MDC0203765.1 sodium/solute symporter [Candidatus Nitrosopelagicus sp.]MDC0211437.1 sodium/solute symporter [Candidatus Nitrosopelagicus sp.]